MKITDRRHGSIIIARGEQDVRRALESDDLAPTQQSANEALRRGKMAAPQGMERTASVMRATERHRDINFYWDRNNDFYSTETEDDLKDLRDICRKLYKFHPMLGSVVDVFSQWPLTDMKFVSKDEKLTEFYSQLFFEDLDYESYLVSLGVEYWTVGEALPMGTWNKYLGIWDHDELIDSNTAKITKSPFLREPLIEIQLPEEVRRLLTTQEPAELYRELINTYPEFQHFTTDNQWMPVSGHLIKQIKFNLDNFHARGLPLMSRAMRPILQEEMLNSAQDAIADRLTTPMIHARIGASANDLGTKQPWIPSQDQIEEFNRMMDAALSADFRMLSTHFGVQMSSVFGRETMPNLNPDFERLTDRLLQPFGISRTMLMGSQTGQTYAADALNRDLVTQLLRKWQQKVINFVRERALVVAEAQEHFDYRESHGKRTVIMEEVLEVDPESGERRIIQQPKLLVPDLHLRCMALGTKVMTPTGPVAAEDLKVGDLVVAWDEESDTLVDKEIVESLDNGVEPVYEITTKLGRSLRVTDEHPFWTDGGWVQAKDITVGAEVRVGTNYTPTGPQSISERDAYFIGLMAGDGGMTGNDVRLANKDMEVIDWVNEYVFGHGCHAVPVDDRILDYRICQREGRVNPNPIKKLLSDWGVWGHKWDAKRVPSVVWESGPHVWAAFLSGYLDTDGTVKADAHVAWDSKNRDLLEDCQTLLAFMGVRSQIQQKPITPTELVPNPIGDIYRLIVASKNGLLNLQKALSPKIERKKVLWSRVSTADARRLLDPYQAHAVKESVKARVGTYEEIGKMFGVSRNTVFRAVKGQFDTDHLEFVFPEWDTVASVELLPAEATWSLGVDGLHTHITNGLVTHNTMNLKDEEQRQNFIENLRGTGVPISTKTRLGYNDVDLEEEMETLQDEQVDLAVREQETRKRMYTSLKGKGLPIPQDLRDDFEPKAQTLPEGHQSAAPAGTGEGEVVPTLGSEPISTPALAPVAEDAMGQEQPMEQPQSGYEELPTNQIMPQDIEGRTRPEESDEMRAGMPKPASVTLTRKVAAPTEEDEDAMVTEDLEFSEDAVAGPGHIGARRYVSAARIAQIEASMNSNSPADTPDEGTKD